MLVRTLLAFVLLFGVISASAQTNFSYTPEKPKPGETITITYTPAGDIANTLKPVEAVAHVIGPKNDNAIEIALTKSGTKYTGTLETDTAATFIYIGFSSNEKFDNNYNKGYWIQLYENDKLRKGSSHQLAIFYQYRGGAVGVERNAEKAFEAFNKEITDYPEYKKQNLGYYVGLVSQSKKDEAPGLFQKEIEAIVKDGLKDETDYDNLEMLYRAAKLPEQSKMMTNLKKEKFPKGRWVIEEELSKIQREQDPVKKEEIFRTIKQKVESDESWSYVKERLPAYEYGIPYAYLNKKDWEGLKKAAASITDKELQTQVYNSAAWEMQKKSENLPLAEEFSRIATTYVKNEWQKPTAKKPSYMTQKQWDKQRQFMYAMYADTYAMVMYRSKQYKKGLPFAKDAAITINKGNDPDQNNTYSLLAEKTLPAKQYKKEIEQFVKDGKSSSEMKDILQRLYVKEKGSDAGFAEYITALQKENIERMIAELKKSMLSEKAPVFALNDLDGKKVDIADLKGKVVVVDFWATWCGPCKASFPGMQKMVTKFKEDPNVKFVFIDTWENGEDKKKLAGDFITNNKYSFHVLMDNENKVVEQFKVEGIPTKFVIDKTGIIRFKSVGFDGSDDKLINELTAMIDLAAAAQGTTESKKAFK